MRAMSWWSLVSHFRFLQRLCQLVVMPVGRTSHYPSNIESNTVQWLAKEEVRRCVCLHSRSKCKAKAKIPTAESVASPPQAIVDLTRDYSQLSPGQKHLRTTNRVSPDLSRSDHIYNATKGRSFCRIYPDIIIYFHLDSFFSYSINNIR
jgi:hypothetical protein